MKNITKPLTVGFLPMNQWSYYGERDLMAPEREPHSYYNTEVADYLRILLRGRAKIRDAKPTTLPNNSEPQPDIAIVKPLERSIFTIIPTVEIFL